MIELKDTRGDSFKLFTNRAADKYFYAARADMKIAINNAKLRLVEYATVDIYKNQSSRFNRGRFAIDVPVYKKTQDRLVLGCHTFTAKNSRIIERWANTK